MSKNIVPAGTSIYLTPEGSVWRWLGERLDNLSDELMYACREGYMKRIEARTWITNNIEPLETRFEEENERSMELIEDILNLESPLPPPEPPTLVEV